ncbi:MAG TPA: glycosyltransferase family 1 protein [Thermoanaerobaculia bacterium]|nr:glycosyltransferase family 1 protein [Thermoanaerobaculia bacterium]
MRALVPLPTGIGVYTRSLALALAGRGGMRYLGLAHRPPRGSGELRAAGIEVEPPDGVPGAPGSAAAGHPDPAGPAAPPSPHGVLSPLSRLGVVWQQLVLPRRLRRGDVDLLWSPLLTLPLDCPVPAVVTVHDLTVLLMPEAHRAKVRLSLLPFLAASLRRARRLVTLSHATAADIAFHFPAAAGRVRVVYPGVDDEFRPATAAEIAATREELGAPHGYLLYAGTLEPRKNVGALLDAWESLAVDDPAFPPLVLAGPYGWGSRALANRIARLAAQPGPEAAVSSAIGHGASRQRTAGQGGARSAAFDPGATGPAAAGPVSANPTAGAAAPRLAPGRRVLALGRLDRARLVRVFQAASLFVYPSLYEGFGLPPAEALACGVPAVVLDTSSLPEVVGDAGLRVPPGDTAALGAALARLTADPGLAAELAGRTAAQAGRFRWQRAAAEMEEVFREALARDGCG